MIAAVPSSRSVAFAAIVLLHVVGLAAIIAGRPVMANTEHAAITVHEVPVARLPDVAPAVTLAAIPVDLVAPPIEIADAAPTGTGACAIADELQSALASDLAVKVALAAVPLDRRSMANAVMVWNGGWADAAASVRHAVVAQLQISPASCREIAVTGPRLLIIPTGNQPVVLAFGSGRWKWADLLSGSTTITNGSS